jgi:orotate phosphoribosyltransferase
MHPEGLVLIGALGLAALNESGWNVQAVGGLTLGADPIACAISYASAGSNNPVRAFTVRKTAKEHGTRRLIEGPLEPTDSVAIIEDVITTGDSALRAIDAVVSAGAVVRGVLALVDREEGGKQNIEAQRGLPVLCLTRASEILFRTRD